MKEQNLNLLKKILEMEYELSDFDKQVTKLEKTISGENYENYDLRKLWEKAKNEVKNEEKKLEKLIIKENKMSNFENNFTREICEGFSLLLLKDEEENRLRIGFYALEFYYFLELGFIQSNGGCYFLNDRQSNDCWELWKKWGFRIHRHLPEIYFEGLRWDLTDCGKLIVKNDINKNVFSYVYDFKHKNTYTGITSDNNFLKKDSENRIILFSS